MKKGQKSRQHSKPQEPPSSRSLLFQFLLQASLRVMWTFVPVLLHHDVGEHLEEWAKALWQGIRNIFPE